MKSDLHVHSLHSGMSHLPVFRRFCRECYSPPEEVYATLKKRGMSLITLTDHDSIEGGEVLKHYPDFFLSEEVTCRMPSGTTIHVGVYDLEERHHAPIQRRRDDLVALLIYLTEQRLFFTINHVFSSLTGRRADEDFFWFEKYFPAFETRNGHMLPDNNLQAWRAAQRTLKPGIAGSDAHTLASLASAYTEVPGARDKTEFLAGLRTGKGRLHGGMGSYWKLTRDIFLIGGEMMREKKWTALLAPLALAVPPVTFANYCTEILFARGWGRRINQVRAPFRGAVPGGARAWA